MAYNWLMMTSSGDDNRPSGSLGLLTDKTTKKKIKINRRQSTKPPSLRLRGLKKNKPKVKHDRARLRLRGNKSRGAVETAQK